MHFLDKHSDLYLNFPRQRLHAWHYWGSVLEAKHSFPIFLPQIFGLQGQRGQSILQFDYSVGRGVGKHKEDCKLCGRAVRPTLWTLWIWGRHFCTHRHPAAGLCARGIWAARFEQGAEGKGLLCLAADIQPTSRRHIWTEKKESFILWIAIHPFS